MADKITSNYLYENHPLDARIEPIKSLLFLNEDFYTEMKPYKGTEILITNTDTTNVEKTHPFNNKFPFTAIFMGTSRKPSEWKIKDNFTVKTYAEIEPFEPYVQVGNVVTVINDENNDDEMSKYTVSEIDEFGKPVWIELGSGACPGIPIGGDDI